jgi:hypothetical protein
VERPGAGAELDDLECSSGPKSGVGEAWLGLVDIVRADVLNSI